MKTAVFLSIREKATRLPKKVLKQVAGQSMTEHLIDRLKTATQPDLIVMCTSVHPDDTVLCDIALAKGIHYFRGSEEDKLLRYLDAARAFDVEFFTVVDGDDIFCSAETIDREIEEYRRSEADYIVGDQLPLGATPFGVRTEALAQVVAEKSESDTEVWGSYFTASGRYKVVELPPPDASWAHPEYRMTLDYPEDLTFFNAVIEALHKPGEVFSFQDLMDYLNAHPDVVALNIDAQARYEEHLKKSPTAAAPAGPKRDIPASRQNTTALVVGLGSMGKRRVRCLKALGVGRILGFDPREDRRAEAAEKYGIEPFGDVDEALAEGPSVMIVSTPPDRHLEYALKAAQKGIHFFTEAGVLAEGFEELEELARRNNAAACPSCTMRFFPGPRKARELIESGTIGRPCSFTYHCGQYLPDWHPWESIKDFYVSNPLTGACREIVPFELVWLSEILGPFGKVKAMRGRLGDLDCDIQDTYHLLLTSADAKRIGHLTVDVLARPAVRVLRVVGTAGQLVWDASANRVDWYTMAEDRWESWTPGSGTIEAGYINPEEPYIEEIERVLLAAEGTRPYGYTYREDADILQLLYDAEADSPDAK